MVHAIVPMVVRHGSLGSTLSANCRRGYGRNALELYFDNHLKGVVNVITIIEVTTILWSGLFSFHMSTVAIAVFFFKRKSFYHIISGIEPK